VQNSDLSQHIDGSEIAIIGMAGRFPGAKNIDEFWENIRDGIESITFFTDEDLLAAGIKPAVLSNSKYVKARPVLDDIDVFDASFFGFSPKDAALMDPQLRLFMECVWNVLESAGYDPEAYEGTIGVCAGASMSSYLINNVCLNPNAHSLVRDAQCRVFNNLGSLATLIAYKLNLKGPCYSIQTFCSTSLVAVHMACQSLLDYECDMAIAGGASIIVPQRSGYWYEDGFIVSPNGHCRPFDANAKGTIFGSGLGAVLLKRIDDALKEGDTIEAVIKGSATNNDGSLKVSFTAPSVAGQAEVIAEALANADVQPDTISCIEAHGTGTALGDPAEVRALTQAFRSATQRNGFCALGSVKSNIGHLDAAAGIAALIKTILAIKHSFLPPSINFKNPNPDIDFENSPFFVNTKPKEWKTNGYPRRAGVSAFGFGGTNAHVILQEAPVREPSGKSRSHQLLVLSAKTSTALKTATKNLLNHLKRQPDLNLADSAYTLQVGRKAFSHRKFIVGQSVDEVITSIEAEDRKNTLTAYQERRNPPVIFMFSGQGSQYVNMGLDLYHSETLFREQIDLCSEKLNSHLGFDLRTVLYPQNGNLDQLNKKLKQTFIAQPALFTIEIALAKLWMSWGIQPEAMVGHSIGEYVAACLAGVFSLEDALSLVAKRGRLMQELPSGSMLAVPLPEEEIKPHLGEHLFLATVNAPALCVVSGTKEAVANIEKQLAKKNVHCRNLHTSHAFHSKMMDPILEKFTECVNEVRRHPPKIRFLSNLTGTWITPDEAVNPSYWAKHLRQTVRFSQCILELMKENNRVFLEIGAGRTLTTLTKQHVGTALRNVVLSSIRHPNEKDSDVGFIMKSLGQLWLAGVQPDWTSLHRDEKRYRIPLPTYPFERNRYWLEGGKSEDQTESDFAIKVDKLDTPVEVLSTIEDQESTQERGVEEADRNEQLIAKIFQEVLGLNRIDIQDDFFGLGGNSLAAVQLFSKIEQITGRKLPLATLYEASTVKQLAKIINDQNWKAPWATLIEIQPGDSYPPLFLVHGAGGNVLIYRELANHLGSDQPVYGLQSKGLDGVNFYHTGIEEMAIDYLPEIKKVQPKGPYLLGGYCMGGTVALEMAQRLCEMGDQVAMLALFETYNFSQIKKRTIIEQIFYYFQKADFHWRNFWLLDKNGKRKFINEKIKVAGDRRKVWLGTITSKLGRHFEKLNGHATLSAAIWKANDQAALSYIPKVYPGRITQFLPIKDYKHHYDPQLGWENLAAGGLEKITLPVYPAGMLVDPFVSLTAEKLKSCIEKACKYSDLRLNS
jgi:acyl transferase domain-containing protein/pimeloyl-ACP methyl ester carboxylesterase